jgi:hypothetical protein
VTLMRALTHKGMTLVYDTDDVENVEVATPRDVIDITRAEDVAARLQLGQAHLELRIDFKPGKQAMWVKGDAVEPEGVTIPREQLGNVGDILTNLRALIAQQRGTCGPPITGIELTRADLEEIKRTYGYVTEDTTEDGPFIVAFGMLVKLVDET